MDPRILDEEVWLKIFLLCDIRDITALGKTCKYLQIISNIDYLWITKWQQLTSELQFGFPDVQYLQSLSVDFKATCLRLHTMLRLQRKVKKCDFCGGYSSKSVCGQSVEIIIDIGSKNTILIHKVISQNPLKHLSGFGFGHHFLKPSVRKYNSFVNLFEHTDVTYPKQNESSRSLFVEPEEEIFEPPENLCLQTFMYHVYYPGITRTCFSLLRVETGFINWQVMYEKLVNEYCADIMEINTFLNGDIASVAKTMLNDAAFPILKIFINYLITPYTKESCNMTLIFCEPLTMHPVIRKQLLHYLFQETRISRVCLLPKPLVSCAMLDMDNCIIVDSGALSTTVAVVIQGRVVQNRWKLLPVGGWHLTYQLKQGMSREKGSMLYSDMWQAKRLYGLKYNITNIQGQWYESLYTAPEIMYNNLNLPQVIKDVTSGLSEEELQDCFSNILLTGGNTNISGFGARLVHDLQKLLPEYSQILDIKNCPNICKWYDSAASSIYLTVIEDLGKTPPEYIEGSPVWLSREEYILFGCKWLER